MKRPEIVTPVFRKPVPHGKPSTYTNYKCRCGECRAAWAEYQALRKRVRGYWS